MENFEYVKNITDYYENGDEDGRLINSKHGQVEFLTTMRYIEKYLIADAKIIEIGAGTGVYSHALALKGYDVTAVELVRHNIDIFESKTQQGEKVSIIQGNALDLSGFDDNMFDITLLFGPMYHLYTYDDKLKALSEALRVTKQNGIVFIAYCIDYFTIIDSGFVKNKIVDFINDGLYDKESFKQIKSKDIFWRTSRKEINALAAEFKVERLYYVMTDGLIRFIQNTVDDMTDEMFELYLKYHFTVCEQEDLTGATTHSLDILRKL